MEIILYIDDDDEVSCAQVIEREWNYVTIVDLFDADGIAIPVNEYREISIDINRILYPTTNITLNKDIYIRHYTSNVNGYPKASMFIPHNQKINNPSNNMGSGIYGIYINDDRQFLENVDKVAHSMNPTVKYIDLLCLSPFIIQDKYHLMTLSKASYETTQFIASIQSSTNPRQSLNSNENTIHKLTNLWNIVFLRNGTIPLNYDIVYNILYNYIIELQTDISITDTQGNITHVLPINKVFTTLGYYSLVSNDISVNNFAVGSLILNYYDYTNIIESKGINRLLQYSSKNYAPYKRSKVGHIRGLNLDDI